MDLVGEAVPGASAAIAASAMNDEEAEHEGGDIDRHRDAGQRVVGSHDALQPADAAEDQEVDPGADGRRGGEADGAERLVEHELQQRG